VLERTSEPIQFPNNHDVARPHFVEQLGQYGTLRCGTTDNLRINLAAAGCLQRVDLKRDGLIAGTDTDAANISEYFAVDKNRSLYSAQNNKSNSVSWNQYFAPKIGQFRRANAIISAFDRMIVLSN
jgi:hypothetical protein